MFFFIADISGYTAYMISNNTASDHAKQILTTLIECIVKEVHLPLEISKLEGDAIFLYLPQQVEDKLWLTKKIFTFFDTFEKKLNELKVSRICLCGACVNIEKLQLKVIAHFGTASIQKIGRFKELSGVDVIILHRLLKNHVPSHRYFLLTEAAYQHMLIPDTTKVTKLEESYDDVGIIPIYVCVPPIVDPSDLQDSANFFQKGWHWLLLNFGKRRDAPYHNLPKVPPKKS